MLETLAAALAVLAAAAPSAADRAAIERTVVAIFKPYEAGKSEKAVWELPIWSADAAKQIAEWRAVAPKEEPDGLSDGNWLCQCQDWDASAFSARIDSISMTSSDTAEVAMTLDLGVGGGPEAARTETLTLRREGKEWKIEEIAAADFPKGLRQALRDTIAEDTAATR